MSDTERQLRVRLADLAPEGTLVPGYGDAAGRAGCDRLLRDGVCAEMGRLRARIAEMVSSAEEEGEDDMRDDLERIGARMERTSDALAAAPVPAGLSQPDLPEGDREALRLYDLRLLEDLELLSRDVMGMKYETIGSLTLREVEGTLAAIELKVVNRKDVLETSGGS